jgi:hypothetical protein
MSAMQHALADASVPYVDEINQLTDRLARPWHMHPAFSGGTRMAGAGPEFARGYAAA